MLFIGPALFVAYLGFVITALVIAVALAALAARQVRATQTLMRERSGAVIVAGLVGLIGLPLAAALVMVTIVGIPLGLTMLLGVLPLLYVGGYLVVAIWIGEWLLGQAGRPAESRPIAAAIVGTLVVGVISLVPFVGGLVGFFGFGAVMLQLWQRSAAPPQPRPSPPMRWRRPWPDRRSRATGTASPSAQRPHIDTRALLPGLRLVPAPGHTPGTQVIVVATGQPTPEARPASGRLEGPRVLGALKRASRSSPVRAGAGLHKLGEARFPYGTMVSQAFAVTSRDVATTRRIGFACGPMLPTTVVATASMSRWVARPREGTSSRTG